MININQALKEIENKKQIQKSSNGWITVKKRTVSSHKFSGKIRYQIPNSPYKTNYLPFYSKEVCKIIYFARKVIKDLSLDLQEKILFEVLQEKNATIGWYHYK